MSLYKIKNLIKKKYTAKEKIYKVCKNSCALVPYDKIQDYVCCTHCRSTELKNHKQFSIAHQLGLSFVSEKSRDDLYYRHNYVSTNNYDSIYDGSAYKSMKHLMASKNDILFSLYVDSFNPFQRGGLSQTMIMGINLNLPPEIRYKKNTI